LGRKDPVILAVAMKWPQTRKIGALDKSLT
jgi:hypothetical protein